MFHRRKGSGPAVVLLHGFASSSLFWSGLMDSLQADFDLIAPDWPGFGAAGRQPPYRRLQDFASGLFGLADELGLERMHVVGHSMSGFVVQELLCRHPDRLDRVVLYGAGLSVNRGRRFETVAQTLQGLRAEGVEAAARKVVDSWFADAERSTAARAACLEAAAGMSAEGAAAAIEATQDADYTDKLRSCATPALVLSGEAERSHPPASALELYRALGNAHLCILPLCGHAAHLERPLWFEAVLREFLAG
ncbi:alpha/beta hydrolase [Candidimonas humi]|uniref:Alpha/beta fold hydrolase n=1 Tax=Candidimonas humi TaxID=683355 RepID=A0ABV8P0J8_9BURK|nr:alpha/beta hydrolase [Candidimonas humi]MBV6304168.1 alpha/beta hydrolase [Candidimonas humi]